MRVVVTGLVAAYPVGGVAWDYLQYVQGFQALGCEVVYLEDTGQWLYDPVAQTFTDDVAMNARWLADALAHAGRGIAWALRAPDGTYHGLDAGAVDRACAGADLFLNVSGSCWLREAYRGARVKAHALTGHSPSTSGPFNPSTPRVDSTSGIDTMEHAGSACRPPGSVDTADAAATASVQKKPLYQRAADAGAGAARPARRP